MWRLFRMQSERLALYPRYGAILTHTAHMRDEMARHGLPASVVPFPVEPGIGAGAPPSDGAWRLLFAGRMENLKGGHYLIEALPEIVSASPSPVRAIFAGDGSQRARWERRARQIEGATANLKVEFTGWLGHEQVDALMTKVDLLVVPSLWPEPFGTVGPSAGRHDLPAAAFNSGGIRQWLEDGVSGHLAPADPPTPAGLARAVTQCLEDPVHYAALRLGAREMAARFTMDRHLEALMEHFERVCA
jgi:glycosyltransferase involved in cell wall biosynthesis